MLRGVDAEQDPGRDTDQLRTFEEIYVQAGRDFTAIPWAALAPHPALVAWLEAFVLYASGKRRFLNELHEAFEKNPDLRVAVRERIEGALSIVLTRAQQAGEVRMDIDGPDLMQLLGSMCMSATLTTEQSARLLAMIEDGLRPPV